MIVSNMMILVADIHWLHDFL